MNLESHPNWHVHVYFYFCKKVHQGPHQNGKSVFGVYKWGTGCNLMEKVWDCTFLTLEAIIHCWILPGTRILSDVRAAYSQMHLILNGIYMHDITVHQDYFIHPDIHMQNVESMWERSKQLTK